MAGHPFEGTYISPESSTSGIGTAASFAWDLFTPVGAAAAMYKFDIATGTAFHPLMGPKAPFSIGGRRLVTYKPGAGQWYSTVGRFAQREAAEKVTWTRRGPATRWRYGVGEFRHPGIWGLKGFARAETSVINPWHWATRAVRSTAWAQRIAGSQAMSIAEMAAGTGGLWGGIAKFGKGLAGGTRIPVRFLAGRALLGGLHVAVLLSLASLAVSGATAINRVAEGVGYNVGAIAGRITAALNTRFADRHYMLARGYMSPQASTERNRALSALREAYGVRRAVGNEAYLMHRQYRENEIL